MKIQWGIVPSKIKKFVKSFLEGNLMINFIPKI